MSGIKVRAGEQQSPRQKGEQKPLSLFFFSDFNNNQIIKILIKEKIQSCTCTMAPPHLMLVLIQKSIVYKNKSMAKLPDLIPFYTV